MIAGDHVPEILLVDVVGKFIEPPEHIGANCVNIGFSVGLIVTVVELELIQPKSEKLYVTVYIPAELVLGEICPVIGFIFNPLGLEVYVPPVVPV